MGANPATLIGVVASVTMDADGAIMLEIDTSTVLDALTEEVDDANEMDDRGAIYLRLVGGTVKTRPERVTLYVDDLS